MQELLDHIDSLKAELDSYRPISNEHMNRIMQKLHLEWNFNSNSMEGNTLTMTETRQLLYYGITAKGKPLKDHIEMRGQDIGKRVGTIYTHPQESRFTLQTLKMCPI